MGSSQSQPSEGHSGALKEVITTPDSQPKALMGDNKIQGLTRLITAQTRRKKDVQRDQYDFTKENMQLLKHMFKKMDPSVMKMEAGRTHGDVQLSFKYEPTRELLLVKVIRCRDLSAKDLRGRSADPYVQMYIHPLREDHPVHRTQVVKKSLNPQYHEIFTFPISDHQLQDGKMIAQVWDKDIMDHDDFIGEVVIQFSSFDFTLQPVHTAWYTLQAETDLSITGDLEVSLTYTHPSTLTVTVHKANNLTNHYETGSLNPFVKIQVPGIKKSLRETNAQYDTVSPVWEESFDFNVPVEEFSQRYVIFHVVDYDDSATNDTLGQAIVDLDNFDPHTGFRGSFALADLKNSERLKSRVFQQATVQEFRESLMAHASFRNPKFLFQKHTGTKVIRVTSRKAGSQAKLHIINGIPVS